MLERILVVEDEETLRENLAAFLVKHGCTVTTVATGREAIRELSEHSFDILITDIYLPDIDGLEVLRQLQSWSLNTTALVMTAFGSMESAIEAFQCGAHDYILKPFSFEDMHQKLINIAANRKLIRENNELRAQIHRQDESRKIIHHSKAMCDLLKLVGKLASVRSNVLVTGETGTGKELVAHALHEQSTRHAGLFLPFNVAAIPEGLVESHLFGHKKGAFTGANSDRNGFFRSAENGTLFLDEIGELPLPLQAKLLRAVEEKEIIPLGSDHAIGVNTRIIAATHRNLQEMADQGAFRQDLLMRLNVVHIHVPSLRERKEDIPFLARHFVARHCREMGRKGLTLNSDVLHRLVVHDWKKGNIRELSNVIERAVIECDGNCIGAEHIPAGLDSGSETGYTDLKSAVRDFENRYISRVLESVEGDRDVAARALGISVATLYRRMH